MTILLAILAAWRIAHLFAEETGPFAIGIRWRNLHTADDWVGEGMRCVLCLSFWAALPLSVWLCVAGGLDPWLWPLWWLGIAGGAAALQKALDT